VSLSDNAHELKMSAFRNAERFPPLDKHSDRPARKSQHSQHSPGIHAPMKESGSLSVVKSRVLGSVSSGSVVLYEVRDYPAS